MKLANPRTKAEADSISALSRGDFESLDLLYSVEMIWRWLYIPIHKELHQRFVLPSSKVRNLLRAPAEDDEYRCLAQNNATAFFPSKPSSSFAE